ncbi:adenine-specific DNA-methyltransferase [groundwater metagenome]
MYENFRNEIVWQRNTSHNDGKKFGCVHDVIYFYTKGNDYNYRRIEIERSEDEHKKRFPSVDENGRRYTLDNLAAAGSGPPRRFGDKMPQNTYGKPARPFELWNIGNYETVYWQEKQNL